MRFNHPEAGRPQQVAQDLPIVLLVLNDENRPHPLRPACNSTRAGAVNENVAPRPTLESPQRPPPCISTILLAMASPRPEPLLALVIELSTCWNSSKIFA